MNERKTENIVRNHFEKFSDIIIEEQKSENPRIDKFLKTASKKGQGHGYPEFIIQFKNNSDLIIVVECKADIVKHQSPTLDKYNEYAVDGVLLYASFLSKEYDVIAIGISGQNLKELKVSHYLNLKGDKKAIPMFDNKLLDIESYISGYLKSDEKVRQDYNALLDFSRKLNVKLHNLKIAEKDRALLISSILIALNDRAFKKAYKEYEKPEELANFLADTVSNVLRKANLLHENIENLNIQFSFIRSDTSLSTKQGVLKNLIDNIDQQINQFVKTHAYYDILGQLYIEFLRYANNEKGLGIVLTPPHITELFTELADVNKDDIIYDNCAGTGGFLISALNKMIKDAKDDGDKINHIKENQVIGTEFQSHIYALACSNMYIHQDGKTNIIKDDCFEPHVIEYVKKRKPTIGFLNPPYKVDENDKEELEFVLNNLETLSLNAKCIAIVPISCVLADNGIALVLKSKILSQHTLEAVLSMPEQLFHNSKVGVVTSVLIITAHKPHPPHKKTWFGYFRNDGFKVLKHKGRDDFNNEWNMIKKTWINSFKNREEVTNLSVAKEVNEKDEWCAEAYMKTDYSKLSDQDFINELKRYAAYSIMTS
jgi:type I restriction enzyme M protein